MFKIPQISPSQAIQFPRSSNQNIPGLPISAADCKYFQTVTDANQFLVMAQNALNAFLATQQNGQMTALQMSSSQTDGNGNVVCAYLGMMASVSDPVFIYMDPALTYQCYIVNYSISFQVPLPPNQPGPYNPPTIITGQVAIGDVAGTGSSLIFVDQDGSYFFKWQ